MIRAVAIALIALSLVAACGRQASDGATIVAKDLKDLVARSDVVILGTVSGEGGTRNLARNPNNPTQEDPNTSVIAQDYTVTVEATWKGQIGPNATVTLAKGAVTRDGSLALDSDFIPLATGVRYALFLRRSSVFTGVLSPTAEPFRFRVDGLARVESAWRDAGKYFPARTPAQLLADVKGVLGTQ